MRRAAPPPNGRPRTRSECADGLERPCPWVSCRYHLLLDVAEDGRLYVTQDLDEGDEDDIAKVLFRMPETCALDVAERGANNFVSIGRLLNVSKQRVEQVQVRALARIRDGAHEFEEKEHPEDPYLRYSAMGADELAEITAELRRRQRAKENKR